MTDAVRRLAPTGGFGYNSGQVARILEKVRIHNPLCSSEGGIVSRAGPG